MTRSTETLTMEHQLYAKLLGEAKPGGVRGRIMQKLAITYYVIQSCGITLPGPASSDADRETFNDVFTEFLVSLEDGWMFPESFVRAANQMGITMKSIVEEAEFRKVSQYLDYIWSGMSDTEKDIITREFKERIFRALSKGGQTAGGSAFDTRVKETVLSKISDITEEYISEKHEYLRELIQKTVESRWQTMVDDVVQSRLSMALAKVKQEMSR